MAVVHPSGPIAAAVLALAELRPVSGADLFTAFALGVEMTCRLCLGTTVPPADGSFAWSGTGITVGFGAAVGGGPAVATGYERMRVAMGLALSEASGFRAMHGTATVAFMPAHGGQTGLRAALLAERGFTAGLSGAGGKIRISVGVLHDNRTSTRWPTTGRAVRIAAQYLQTVSVRHRDPADHRCVPETARGHHPDPAASPSWRSRPPPARWRCVTTATRKTRCRPMSACITGPPSHSSAAPPTSRTWTPKPR